MSATAQIVAAHFARHGPRLLAECEEVLCDSMRFLCEADKSLLAFSQA